MKLRTIVTLCAIAVACGWQVGAQTYDTNGDYVQTFAGSGFSGYLDGVGQQTMFDNPLAIVADSSSNLFVMDYSNGRIREITPDGTVTTFAGGGSGQPPGYGTNVSIGAAISMTIDHSNTLYLVDYTTGKALVRIRSDGYVTRIPLTALSGGPSVRDGICVDSGNNVYISDYSGNKIYRYTTNGLLEVFAGSGNSGSVDGNGIFTSFTGPAALAADSADNIYVWDSGNHLIRRINQNRDVVTVAGHYASNDKDGYGTNAVFGGVFAMCADNAGNIYLTTESANGGSAIRKMSATTNVTTLAGSFAGRGYVNGIGSMARFLYAEGICLSHGMIFVADSENQRIRQISFNPTPQVVSPADLHLDDYPGLRITGIVGRTYQIQASPDLNTWNPVATVLLTSNPYLWIDQNPTHGKKFYRALLMP